MRMAIDFQRKRLAVRRGFISPIHQRDNVLNGPTCVLIQAIIALGTFSVNCSKLAFLAFMR